MDYYRRGGSTRRMQKYRLLSNQRFPIKDEEILIIIGEGVPHEGCENIDYYRRGGSTRKMNKEKDYFLLVYLSYCLIMGIFLIMIVTDRNSLDTKKPKKNLRFL